MKKRAADNAGMIPEEDEDGEGGIVYSEDEFEEEVLVERNEDYDDEDAWEDVDSQGNPIRADNDDDDDFEDEEDGDMQDETITSAAKAGATK